MDSSIIADRRLLRRRLGFWRLAAVVLLVALGFALYNFAFSESSTARPHIAHVTISGLITDDDELLERLKKIKDNDQVKAVVVSISSPGGTTYGGEKIFKAIRAIAEKKPVVSDVRTLAASAGYMIATAGDTIIAGESSITGSIGVIFQYPQIQPLLDKLGVSLQEIKSSPLKAAPNLYSPTSPEARAAIMSLVEDSYGWFKGLVKDRRSLDDAQLKAASDGRVFTAHQALPMHMIDQIGDEDAARDWLAKNKNVSKDLPIRDWQVQKLSSSFRWLSALIWAAQELGLSTVASFSSSNAVANFGTAPQLDGLLALWQPPSQQ